MRERCQIGDSHFLKYSLFLRRLLHNLGSGNNVRPGDTYLPRKLYKKVFVLLMFKLIYAISESHVFNAIVYEDFIVSTFRQNLVPAKLSFHSMISLSQTSCVDLPHLYEACR